MNHKMERVGFEIRKLHCMTSKALENNVKAAGIDEGTLMHGWILRYLYENREREVFQKDIEKFFLIGRSTVTGIIQTMERNGYIVRESVTSDARLKKVLLTQKGIENHQLIEETIDQTERELLQGIQPEELEVFMSVACKMRENLKKQLGTEEEDINA